jgi:hypothetical protein
MFFYRSIVLLLNCSIRHGRIGLSTSLQVPAQHDFFDAYSPISINPYVASKKYAPNTNQTRAKMIRTLETLHPFSPIVGEVLR